MHEEHGILEVSTPLRTWSITAASALPVYTGSRMIPSCSAIKRIASAHSGLGSG